MGVVSTIITDSRLLAGVDSGNVPDDVAIDKCDDIYQELVDLKKMTTEDFLHTQSFIDTVIYQNEYPLPTGFKKFEKMILLSQLQIVPTYPAWAASTVYTAGTKCVYGGKTYICNLDHTSGGSFPYTNTYTTSAIMVAGTSVTINGLTYTARADGTNCTLPGDFSISTTEALCLANLMAVINSATAGTSSTFLALSDYNKSLNTAIELVATNPTTHTIVITYNKPIIVSETSGVGAWGSETGGNWIEIYEGYNEVTPMKLDYHNMQRYEEVGATNPVYFFMEDKIRIYPRPTVAVTKGLMLDYIQRVPTLTTATDDAALFIEDKFYKAWKYGLAFKMQEYCALDSSLMRSDYEIYKGQAQARWANRHMNKTLEIMPIMSNLRRDGR